MKNISLIGIILTFISCAQIVSPTGGEKDTNPPKVKYVQPLDQTRNFNSKEIKIKFDEYIDIKEPEQIIISPLITEKPIIESNGKEIKIDLKKSKLERDKTYTINFGNSISDNHEGTKIENFSYCFSTGNSIDSCNFKGEVTAALTGKPEKAITIGLYKSNEAIDSLYIKEYPIYIGKTNEKGIYLIKNLPNQTFSIFGFNDINKNLKFDPNEDFTFIKTSKNPCETVNPINLKTNQARLYPSNRILDTIQYSANTFVLSVYDNQLIKPYQKNGRNRIQNNDNQVDSIFFFFQNPMDTGTSTLEIIEGNEKKDIKIRNRKKSKTNNFQINVPNSIHPDDTLIITSKTPFTIASQDSIQIKLDTTYIKTRLLRKDSFSILIPFNKTQGQQIELQLKDSALIDLWKTKIKPTKSRISVLSEKETGTLQLNIVNNENKKLILELLSDTEKQETIKTVKTSKSEQILIKYITPGTYLLRISEDINSNQIWDPANWRKDIEMEPITIYPTKITIKANWDIEQQINIESMKW